MDESCEEPPVCARTFELSIVLIQEHLNLSLKIQYGIPKYCH